MQCRFGRREWLFPAITGHSCRALVCHWLIVKSSFDSNRFDWITAKDKLGQSRRTTMQGYHQCVKWDASFDHDPIPSIFFSAVFLSSPVSGTHANLIGSVFIQRINKLNFQTITNGYKSREWSFCASVSVCLKFRTSTDEPFAGCIYRSAAHKTQNLCLCVCFMCSYRVTIRLGGGRLSWGSLYKWNNCQIIHLIWKRKLKSTTRNNWIRN